MEPYKRISIQQIPAYNLPKIKEVKANGGYWTYGDDNQFPEWIINLFYGSALHNGIVLRKRMEIIGNGLFSASANEKLEEFISECNNAGQSLNDIFRKITLDYILFGGFALQIVYGKASDKISAIYYLDFSKLRRSTDPKRIKYSKNWKAQRVTTTDHPLYGFRKDDEKEEVFYFTDGGSGTRNLYPIPEYVGSLASIETDIRIANFHLNSIKNGLFPSMMIDFKNGEPSEDQKKAIERDLNAKFGNDANAGKIILSFSDKDNPGPSITKIEQPDQDKMFIVLQDSVRDTIMRGHGITTPAIFGVAMAAKLGNVAEYTQGNFLFRNAYVKPQQKVLIAIFNKLLAVNFKSKDFTPDLQILPVEPLDNVFNDEMVLASQMTTGEVRSKLVEWGYIKSAELQPGEKVIGITDTKPAPNKTADPSQVEPANNVPIPGQENI